ncbi:hypothetical protein [Paraburkholderia dinghuensis]|uniref:Uncharacterized protein n=1 Tax=Paraburkholderia dinghuensis TaxID=2305225 RepID=A0A3N6N122_9BURK|nr:hypothetical protein [Paraburkholderia dinghuensis]RQH09779.1 hypothetical protein D1Y85_01105 [Paraburkholderia dinghuensis]
MSTVRNVVAIVLFVLAGLCLTTAQMAAFIDFGHPAMLYAVIGAVFVFSVVLLVAGAFVGTFRPRARRVGVVLITVTAVAAFAVLTWVSILLSPAMVHIFLTQAALDLSLSMFQAGPGLVAIAVTAFAGMWLVRRR